MPTPVVSTLKPVTGQEMFDRLRDTAQQAGLDGFGVCAADPFPEVRSSLEARVADGKSGKLRFTFARPEVATDVRASFSWARCLVVGARSYLPDGGDPGPSRAATGRIARFAVKDFYPVLRRGLEAVAVDLQGAGYRATILVDDNRLVDRAAAVRAGVGWWGKNAMVLAPRFGSWLLLGSVVTDAELPRSEPMRRDCGTCTACLPACPTGALVAPGVLDASRCLAHWSQVPGMIPRRYREAMGDRVYGCDDCLDACPPGQRLLDASRGRPGGRVDLIEVLRSADGALLDRFGHFYLPRRQARYLRRNALVALGNSGGPEALPVLAGYLGHRDWMLRAHAAWAVGRLGGPLARAALDTRLRYERHPRVVAEIRRARQATE